MYDRLVWFVGGALVSRYILGPLLFAPLERWWARWWEETQRLLFVDVDIRWYANGGHSIDVGWRDRCRAVRRRLFWRWSREREELRRHAPLWLDF